MSKIVAGELAVGSLLPREAELAETYGVNRSVVREAIKLLEVHRLVRPIRRRGTEVLDPLASLSPEVLRAMIMPGPGRVDRKVFAEYVEIRAQLDVQMAVQAALHRTEEDLNRLDDRIEAMREALYSPRRYASAMEDVALAIARATHNRIYEMLVHWHQRVAADLDELFLSVRLATPPHLQGMQALAGAIRKGDPEQAGRLVQAFHDWATPTLLSIVKGTADEHG